MVAVWKFIATLCIFQVEGSGGVHQLSVIESDALATAMRESFT